jgi:hypothetical protein
MSAAAIQGCFRYLWSAKRSCGGDGTCAQLGASFARRAVQRWQTKIVNRLRNERMAAGVAGNNGHAPPRRRRTRWSVDSFWML